MTGLFRDLRYALRTLRRSPAYLITCVAVLALGIGANVAIFTVVHSVILTPLPYPDPSRLVFVWEQFPNMPAPLADRIPVARKNFAEWRKQNTVFADMVAFHVTNLEESGDHPRHVSTAFAHVQLLSMLGAKPGIGRNFSVADARQGSNPVAVISDGYFQSRFHRDTAALGKSVTLGGTAYTIIGVLPPKFHLPATMQGLDQLKPDVWVPLWAYWKTPDQDRARQLLVIARMKPGVSLAQARTEMSVIATRLQQADKEMNDGWRVNVFPFDVEDTAPQLHRALLVLLAAVGLLLLIACANLANLTLARATLRSREIAVRLALGATRARIMTHLVGESLLVSITGAAAGLLLGSWCIRLMLALEPPEIQRPELIEINPAVFGFAAVAACLTTLLFGLAPAMAASRTDLNTGLKSGGGWGTSAARVRSRQFLIAVEVALALMLLSGAGLMLRSFQELVATGIGFDTTRLETVDLDLPDKRYRDGASQSRFFREVIDRVRAAPGVVDAAVVDHLPLHSVTMSNFYIAGRPEPSKDSLPIADHATASTGYFHTIGLPLKTGRMFTDADLARNERGGDGVAIVNQAFALKFFPGEDPLGKRLLGQDKRRAFEIVGVVSDYRPMGIEAGAHPQIFWPGVQLSGGTLIVRSRGAPSGLVQTIQNAVWSVDKDIVADKVKPMTDYVDEWQSQRKFNTMLMAIFAGLALLLAMMGIYGVLSNMIASRVREIGIRMAIGARPAEIGKLVLRQSMGPVAAGVVVGLAGSLALSRFLEALLFQVRARDPLTLALASCAILLISPAAIYVPLRRATRVDCMVALREE